MRKQEIVFYENFRLSYYFDGGLSLYYMCSTIHEQSNRPMIHKLNIKTNSYIYMSETIIKLFTKYQYLFSH